jgi:hypothetical protein
MTSMYAVDCDLCNGNGLTVGFGGSLIRCSLCFGIDVADNDNMMAMKFEQDDLANRFNEDDYDAWRAGVDAEMRLSTGYAMEADRRTAILQQRSLEIQRQTAERLTKIGF